MLTNDMDDVEFANVVRKSWDSALLHPSLRATGSVFLWLLALARLQLDLLVELLEYFVESLEPA